MRFLFILIFCTFNILICFSDEEIKQEREREKKERGLFDDPGPLRPIPPPLEFDYCEASFNEESEINRIQDLVRLGFTLKQVQMVIRHGDRTPIEYLNSGSYEGDPSIWDCSSLSRLSDFYILGQGIGDSHRLFLNKFVENRQTIGGSCLLGQLTYKGAVQHMRNGKKFRKMYIEEGSLLSGEWDPSSIYIRSGNGERMFQSAQALIRGMYPLVDSDQRENIYVLEHQVDNMTPYILMHCPVAQDLIGDAKKYNEDYLAFLEEKGQLIDQLEEIFDGYISLTGMADYIRSRRCHDFDVTFNNLLSEDLVNQTLKLSLFQSNYFPDTVASRRFSMGSFLWEMFDNFDKLLLEEHTNKFMVYSGHDSSIRPLLKTMGIFDGMWPPLASSLIFEFWERNSQIYLDISYNGRLLTSFIPGCDTEGPCLYTTIKRSLQPVTLPLSSFWSECNSRAFPPVRSERYPRMSRADFEELFYS